MEKLRSEIRAAFEKEQVAHPPVTALRRNVVESVTAHPRRETNYQWLAVAAAVVLGILVVVGLMSARFASHSTMPAHPQPPAGEYGPPPAGVPLLYVHDPNHGTWLIGFDWQGHPRGTLKFAQPAPFVQPAPDGQSFLVAGGNAGNGSGTFLDRLGQPIPLPGGVAGFRVGSWADDNRHFCIISFDQQTFDWILSTAFLGEEVRRVAVIARDPVIIQAGIKVAACSFRNDQAILVREGKSPSEVWVVRLSDGKVVRHEDITSTLVVGVVASRDGKYIAENAPTVPTGSGRDATETRIRLVSDWTVVSTLPANDSVLAFSLDDNLVLASTSPYHLTITTPRHLAVIRWKSGTAIWSFVPADDLGSFIAQPDGNGFALAFNSTLNLQDHLIVYGDGTTKSIPGGYMTIW